MSTHCDYQNDGERITQPGKFEGCPVFAPKYWNLGLDGFADEDTSGILKFKFTAAELKREPEVKRWLGNRRTLHLWEDSQGFVHCR